MASIHQDDDGGTCSGDCSVVKEESDTEGGNPLHCMPSLEADDPTRIVPEGGIEVEVWTRVTPGEEYIKLIVRRGKVVGALLIGDTDLEEVFENLILNELDVSRYGVEILNPDIDIEAYFD